MIKEAYKYSNIGNLFMCYYIKTAYKKAKSEYSLAKTFIVKPINLSNLPKKVNIYEAKNNLHFILTVLSQDQGSQIIKEAY